MLSLPSPNLSLTPHISLEHPSISRASFQLTCLLYRPEDLHTPGEFLPPLSTVVQSPKVLTYPLPLLSPRTPDTLNSPL